MEMNDRIMTLIVRDNYCLATARTAKIPLLLSHKFHSDGANVVFRRSACTAKSVNVVKKDANKASAYQFTAFARMEERGW